VRGKNLELILSLQEERTMNQDNTVHLGPCILQIEKSRWPVKAVAALAPFYVLKMHMTVVSLKGCIT
jgi:hypothetical protein